MIAKYEIRKSFWHKNYVMLLSVVPTLTGTSAMWSAHEYNSEIKPPLDVLKTIFQKAHDIQIDKLIIEEYLNEPEEFKVKSIEDQTKRIHEEL